MSDSFDKYIDKRFESFKRALETCTYGEVSAVNDDSIDVYLPQRDETLPDVPVFTLQGGGEYLQFPIAKGDNLLIFFSKDSVIDWLSGNEISSAYTFSLDGAFALVGVDPFSAPRPIASNTTLNVTKVKIQNETAELITNLSDTLQQVIDAVAAIQLLTVTCATAGSPSSVPINVASFIAVQANLEAEKIKLDSFKV